MIAAIAPLCAAMPIFGVALAGGRSTLNSNVSAAPMPKLHSPMQFGPSIADVRGARRCGKLFLFGAPASPISAKPDANTIAPPTPRRPHAAIASITTVCGTTSTAASTPCGKSSMLGTHFAAVEFRSRAADEVDIALVTATFEVRQDRTAHMAGFRRHADDCDRARPDQAVEPGVVSVAFPSSRPRFVKVVTVARKCGRPLPRRYPISPLFTIMPNRQPR